MTFCQLTKKEKDSIIEATFKQKVANNRKAEAQYAEHQERVMGNEAADQAAGIQSDWGDTLIIRIARAAYGSDVKWKREIKTEEASELKTGSAETQEGEKVRYSSRLFACTRCGNEQ